MAQGVVYLVVDTTISKGSSEISAQQTESGPTDALYEKLACEYAAALDRLAAAYEANPHRRKDLLQEIYFSLWRSLSSFDGDCSTRTWVYRIAHNTAATYAAREQRHRKRALYDLDELDQHADVFDGERALDEERIIEKVQRLIQRFKPLDRQLIVLYFEGIKPAEIAKITGLSPGNVATKIHRLKTFLARHFDVEISHD
jgi:RNA polymerase sigma-70 factor (ECF subfamily)